MSVHILLLSTNMFIETSNNFHVNVTILQYQQEVHKSGSTLRTKAAPNYTFQMGRHFLPLTKY